MACVASPLSPKMFATCDEFFVLRIKPSSLFNLPSSPETTSSWASQLEPATVTPTSVTNTRKAPKSALIHPERLASSFEPYGEVVSQNGLQQKLNAANKNIVVHGVLYGSSIRNNREGFNCFSMRCRYGIVTRTTI